MKYRFDFAARAELAEAIAYYEARSKGLGRELVREVRATITRVLENPRQFPRLSGRVRRAKVRRFPYGLVYAIGSAKLYFLAVMQLQRRPGYWKDRLG